MLIKTIKTHKIKPNESILDLLNTYIPKLSENSIVAITSKIISTCENRLVAKSGVKNKMELIHKESNYCFPSPKKQPNFCMALKDNRLIANAGIDESNCGNFYILLPQKPQLTAKKIWKHLRKKHQIKNLGIIVTDSNVTPFRAGVSGITIGWCGFKPTYSYIGKKDVFGRILKSTQVNLLDNLATAATLMMGEGSEQTPIAIIRNPPVKIIFQKTPPNKKEEQSICIAPEEDLFNTVISYA